MAISQSNRLDSGIKLGKTELSAALGGGFDSEDVELLGRAVTFDVGEVMVPRDWLLEQCDELRIPDQLVPSEIWPSSAYKRGMARLVQSARKDGRPHFKAEKVEFDVKHGNGNVQHLWMSVFFPHIEDGGKWVNHRLGHFDYDPDDQRMKSVMDPEIEGAPELEKAWEHYEKRARALMENMKEHHTGEDLRLMFYYLRVKYTQTIVPLREGGAFYFVPESLSHIINALGILYRRAGQFKSGGTKMNLRTIEVIDTDEKREWIRERVEAALDDMVDDVLEEAFEAADEGEETADEIAREMMNGLSGAIETAEQYNDLLEAKLAVQELLENRMKSVDDEKKEKIVKRVLSQSTL